YPKAPDILRGYVELVYDLNNQPSYRLIEPLVYCSKYYDRAQQSLMLSTITNDDRPFILSTPRLEADGSLHMKVCFDDPVVDELFRLKSSSKAWGEIRKMIPVDASQERLLQSFFTPEPPRAYQPYTGAGVRWRYFGHACILIES